MIRSGLALLVLAAVSPAQTLTRGPSVWSTTDTSFLVAFKTSAPVLGAVEWGGTPSFGSVATGTTTADHSVTVSGLLPDHFYYYRVLLGGQPATPVHRTRTLPAAGSSDLTFFVMGDSGYGSADQTRVADLLSHHTWDFGILPGDIIYPAGERANFDPRFFVPYAPLLHRTPFFPVLGNHDVGTENGAPYLEAFHLPTANSGTERWYSFDVGDVHFVGLDSNSVTNATQTAWLRSDLTAARTRGVRWIFVQFHHPGYSSGYHGRNTTVYNTWCPILEEFEVDAVFNGHDHDYERSQVVRDFHPSRRGVVYFVVGTGGATLYPLTTLQPYSAFGVSRHGLLKVDLRGDVLRTVFLDATDATFAREVDPYEIRRGPVTPALRLTSPNPVLGETLRLAFDAPAGWSTALLFSLRNAYVPLPPAGIYQLTPGTEVELARGVMGPAETAPFAALVPPQPALQGLDLFFQGVAVGPNPPRSPRLTDLLVSVVR